MAQATDTSYAPRDNVLLLYGTILAPLPYSEKSALIHYFAIAHFGSMMRAMIHVLPLQKNGNCYLCCGYSVNLCHMLVYYASLALALVPFDFAHQSNPDAPCLPRIVDPHTLCLPHEKWIAMPIFTSTPLTIVMANAAGRWCCLSWMGGTE